MRVCSITTGDSAFPITATGAAATVTRLATAGANQMFRGVAFAPDTNVVPQIFNPARTTNGFALAWTG